MTQLKDFRNANDRPNDWTPACNKASQSIQSGQTLLGEPNAHYDCFPEMAHEEPLWTVNNGGGSTRCVLLFENKKDLTIDGQNMRLQMRGAPLAGRGEPGTMAAPMIPIVARGCESLTIRNLTIDWQTPFVAQGEIIASQPGRLEIRMHTEQRWWTWNGHLYIEGEGWTMPVQRLLAIQPDTGEMVQGLADNFSLGYEFNWQYSQNSENHVIIEAPPENPLPPVGKLILFWLAGFGTAGRLCSSILLDNCKQVHIENVTLHHAWGMGIVGQRCENIHIDHCSVKPSGERRFSLTADATHFVSCKGKIELNNCHFQNQFDDAINVHGAYLQVVTENQGKEIILRRGHYQHHHITLLATGDHVEWFDANTLTSLGKSLIQSVTELNSECMRVTLAEKPPFTLSEGTLMENTSWAPEVDIHDNTFRWNRARGILMNTPREVRITNNHIECPGNAIVWEGVNAYLESGGMGNTIIRNNHFINCAHAKPWGADLLHIGSAETPAGPHVMGDEAHLLFQDNTIETLNGNLISGGPINSLLTLDNHLPNNINVDDIILLNKPILNKATPHEHPPTTP